MDVVAVGILSAMVTALVIGFCVFPSVRHGGFIEGVNAGIQQEAARQAWENNQPPMLAHVATLINTHGPDSPEVLAYIEEHKDWEEFVALAHLSRELKKALTRIG